LQLHITQVGLFDFCPQQYLHPYYKLGLTGRTVLRLLRANPRFAQSCYDQRFSSSFLIASQRALLSISRTGSLFLFPFRFLLKYPPPGCIDPGFAASTVAPLLSLPLADAEDFGYPVISSYSVWKPKTSLDLQAEQANQDY
jgi:hypothetical protein